MGRNRLLAVIAVVIVLAAVVPTVSGHTYSSYCSPGPAGYSALLNIYQNESGGGATDYACGDDSNWGDSSGPIRSFNDRMTSYHTRDYGGDSYYTCFTFWEHISYQGSYISATVSRQGGGVHFIEDNIGGTWNDRVSSSWLYPFTSSGSCP